jgi:hypothetical protein
LPVTWPPRDPAAAGERELSSARDYGELVFLHELPPPPAIVFIRQEPIPPDAPAEWLASLLSDPALQSGYFITLGSKTIRRRALPSVA